MYNTPMPKIKTLSRLNDYQLTLPGYNFPVSIFANADVPIEKEAVEELQTLLELDQTVETLKKEGALPSSAAIEQLSISPDFHKNLGIPVGTSIKTRDFIIPQAVGKDIGCGMQLIATSLSYNDIAAAETKNKLEKLLRYIFFQGGRQLLTSREQRAAILKSGTDGLYKTANPNEGLWQEINQLTARQNLHSVRNHHTVETLNPVFDSYINGAAELSYDSQLGSIGGGNHFVELQYIKKIHRKDIAYQLGLKENQLLVMAHSGSLNFGQLVNAYILEKLKAAYPKALRHPQNGIYALSREQGPLYTDYWNLMLTAYNFSVVNRIILSQMVVKALKELLSTSVSAGLIYDAPHNLIWDQNDTFLHRKGTTPAQGFEPMQNTPYAYFGEPVIIPGSMGSSSYLLIGKGNPAALESASHGAGRVLSRGGAMKAGDEALEKFLSEFKVVTPVDPTTLMGRRDILEEWKTNLKQEAPFAYKDITPIIETIRAAGIADPVIELYPVMTIKG